MRWPLPVHSRLCMSACDRGPHCYSDASSLCPHPMTVTASLLVLSWGLGSLGFPFYLLLTLPQPPVLILTPTASPILHPVWSAESWWPLSAAADQWMEFCIWEGYILKLYLTWFYDELSERMDTHCVLLVRKFTIISVKYVCEWLFKTFHVFSLGEREKKDCFETSFEVSLTRTKFWITEPTTFQCPNPTKWF